MTPGGVSTAWKALRAEWRGQILPGSLEEAHLGWDLEGKEALSPQRDTGGEVRQVLEGTSARPQPRSHETPPWTPRGGGA